MMMSQTETTAGQPHDREKAVGAAFLRHLGATQVEAANAVGVDRRTVQRWEKASWWADVQREAADRWLHGLAARARRGLQSAVEEDGRLALRVLERLEPALTPAPHRVAVTLDETAYRDLDDDELKRIASGEDPHVVLSRPTGRR